MQRGSRTAVGVVFLFLVAASVPLVAESGPRLEITRRAGEIALDGDLSDEGWRGALVIERWYEVEPGENIDPKVPSRALLTYDEKFLYVGLELTDPDVGKLRAPITDRDGGLTSSDYAGILIDSRNDGKTAQEFLANPKGIQYDGVWSDIAGEDLSPDFYWDSAAKVGAQGWSLELRIPFSSLRFDPGTDPVFGIILFRNWPRDFRYELASVPTPKESDCLVCNAAQLGGFSGLPSGSHWVLAPYATADRTERAEGGPGSELVDHGIDGALGVDFKWMPSASLAVDLTVNPDFSQVESDVGQVSANQRFALFFPEKRPFFLEGGDLFSTPIQAVYTRTITDPRAGVRATGRAGKTSFTALLTQDRGGGTVILPSPTFSGTAPQDFESDVFIGRLRSDFGRTFLSFLAAGREIDGGGSNWVIGPDVEWRPGPSDTVRAQWLWSQTETPLLPELAAEWDGRKLEDSAALLAWSHETGKAYWSVDLREVGDEFRADNGYVPQVGYRDASVDLGYEWGLGGAFSAFRLFVTGERTEPTAAEADDDLLRSQGVGFELKGKLESSLGLWFVDEEVFVATRMLPRRQPRFFFEISPTAAFPRLRLEGFVGEEIDFDNEREGSGASLTASAVFRVGDHLELKLDGERSWLDVDAAGRSDARLFTATLWRTKATYNFTARAFVRAIGQWSDIERDPSLYTFAVDAQSADFSSSLLAAYKLNWQTVFYLGYGGLSEEIANPITGRRTMEPAERKIFVKLSYAFQH